MKIYLISQQSKYPKSAEKKKSLIAVQFHAYIMNSLKKYKHIGFLPSFTLPTLKISINYKQQTYLNKL